MKQVIILMAMILLGVFLFNLIMGNSEDSTINVMKGVWEKEIQMRTEYP